jgi:hypothetical protein
MIGLSEGQLFQKIDFGSFGVSHLSVHIKKQNNLDPDDILSKLASGVAKAITANNEEIERQLRLKGIII